jgi:hypothetical protein
MSELQAYYDNFRAGYWARQDANECRCHGGGWALSEVDTWHKCPVHFHGQTHPEDEGRECDPCDAIPAPVAEPVALAVAKDEVGEDDIPF